MLSKQLLKFFPLLFLAAFTTWLTYKMLTAPVKLPNDQKKLDSFVVKVSVIRMNADTGTPQDQLFSPLMQHYPIGNTTDISSPHFIIFNSNGEPWNITANNGQAQNGITTLQLWNDVKLHQAPGPKNQELTITTSALTIFPKLKILQTEKPVMLVQPSGTVNSVGLHADLNTGEIKLLSQARGQYYSSTQKQNQTIEKKS